MRLTFTQILQRNRKADSHADFQFTLPPAIALYIKLQRHRGKRRRVGYHTRKCHKRSRKYGMPYKKLHRAPYGGKGHLTQGQSVRRPSHQSSQQSITCHHFIPPLPAKTTLSKPVRMPAAPSQSDRPKPDIQRSRDHHHRCQKAKVFGFTLGRRGCISSARLEFCGSGKELR